jgi:uncharacterized damage-inducible protein DinB
MDPISHYHRLFAYDDWANREALRALQAVGTPPGRSLPIMGHLIGAEWVWLGRLRYDSKPAVVWPELTLNQCQAQLGDLRSTWESFLKGLRVEQLAAPVAYKNSKGEAWQSAIGDILMHVVLHSAYHRGQIATALGGAGHTPAYTDFIHGVRQGIIPPA